MNGLDPGSSFKIVIIFIVPRLLHGLNACVLPHHEIIKMEKYYRKLLRCIQGLPDSTSNAATYALLGALPIEALLHMRCFSLLGQIARLDNDHNLKKLAFRQLALYDDNSGSWFSYMRSLCKKYKIDIYNSLTFPWKKNQWQTYYKRIISNFHEAEIKAELHSKSSLKWILWDEDSYRIHQVWTSCQGKIHFVKAAVTRVRMLTQRYSCGASAWRRKIDSSCPVCHHVWDSLTHVLTACPCVKMQSMADKRLILIELYAQEGLTPPDTPEEITSAILNGDRYLASSGSVVEIQQSNLRAHLLTSTICHQSHIRRDMLINAALIGDPIPETDLDVTIGYEYEFTD